MNAQGSPNGESLLRALLDLARQQDVALAADDVDEVNRLADVREPLVSALAIADWTDRVTAMALGRELMARDERNEATIRRLIVETARERAAVARGARAMHGYGAPAQAQSPTSSLLDRSA